MPTYPSAVYIVAFCLHLTLFAYNTMIINSFKCVCKYAFYLHCHLHCVAHTCTVSALCRYGHEGACELLREGGL